MRSFQQVVVFLFALLVCAFAQQSEESYEATVYITSTVYRVNTVTMSTSAPAIPAANTTSTISAQAPPVQATIVPSYAAGNVTAAGVPSGSSAAPSGTNVQPSMPAAFEGAASSLNINAFVVALAAGVAYLV